MLAYVETLTRDAVAAQPEDLEALRAAGFDDTAIVQITLIAAWFNYINRVADGLGVAR
jgi:alkylhydroperoxidase family enzyme